MLHLRMACPRLVLFLLCIGVTPLTYADALHNARSLAQQKQFQEALVEVNLYLNDHPADGEARFLKGLILTQENKTTEAIAVFTELAKKYPNAPEPYNNLAVLYASQGDTEKAKAALEKALSTHPAYATAHRNLGNIYADMASQAYEKALLSEPKPKVETRQTPRLALVDEFRSGRTNTPPVQAAASTTPPPNPSKATNTTAPAQTAAKPAAGAALSPASRKHEILSMLDRWARAWSNRDTRQYFSMYAPDFRLPAGYTLSSWRKERAARIQTPKSIHVTLVAPEITFENATRARVSFKQIYRSGSRIMRARKTMTVTHSGGKWLIQQERAETG
jgi:tetratricopeptide (TPR) repeat protein